MVTLIVGGARSGKSSFALKKATVHKGKKAFIATAQAFDAEMEKRIAKHKTDRSGDWATLEEPLNLARMIQNTGDEYSVLLVDCLTLWLSNLMLSGRDADEAAELLVSAVSSCSADIYLVANEVGMGIVPDNELARKFRDMAGVLNSKIAESADEVYLMAAGIPVKIK
jgi:adenosylcobinamide kinase/adenosylcobinamide-phosphate guanylyltransferase